MMETERCFACDSLAMKSESKYYSRIEYHHVFGRTNSELTLPLCVLCHDLIDRLSLNDINVFVEYLNVGQELEEMPRGKYKMVKLFILKTAKLLTQVKNAQITTDKRPLFHNNTEGNDNKEKME